MSDVSVCETNRGTWLKEGFGSSFNLSSEDEIEAKYTKVFRLEVEMEAI